MSLLQESVTVMFGAEARKKFFSEKMFSGHDGYGLLVSTPHYQLHSTIDVSEVSNDEIYTVEQARSSWNKYIFLAAFQFQADRVLGAVYAPSQAVVLLHDANS